MDKKNMSKCFDDKIELLNEFQNQFIRNSSLNLNKKKNDLNESRNSNRHEQNLRNDISKNKITGLNKLNLKPYQSKGKRINSARYTKNVLHINYDDFQEEQLKLPQIKTFYKEDQTNRNSSKTNNRMPSVQNNCSEKKIKEKNDFKQVTQRIRQSIQKKVQANQNKISSYSTLQSRPLKVYENKTKDTVFKVSDQFLQYLKLNNNNKIRSKQEIKQTIVNHKTNQQKINLTNKTIKKLQQTQNKKINSQQKKSKQRKIKQQQFFQQAKIQNPVFLQIIQNFQQKKETTFKDQNLLFKKKIRVSKPQDAKPIIKVQISIKQQEQKPAKQQKQESKIRIHDVNKTWQRLQTMQSQCHQLSRIFSYEEMNSVIEEDQLNKSMIMRQELDKKCTSNMSQFWILFKIIIEQIEKRGQPVIVTEKSTIRSQITLRMLIGGFMDDIIKVQETIPDDDPNCPFNYDQLYNPEQFQRFCVWYKIRTAIETGLNPNGIVIHSVAKGSIRVQWSTDEVYVLDAALGEKRQLRQRLKLHSFFGSFELSPQDFDPRGNIRFNQQKTDIQVRGGWPYYQPVKCKRYGIRVSGKYDNGNDRWLQMRNKPGQWAVAFHAVRSPWQIDPSSNQTRLKSIMSGINNNTMLRVGINNAYQYQIPQNKPGQQRIGKGIYCSPHIQSTFPYVCLQNEQYYQEVEGQYGLIFQCRVNPKEIKVTSSNKYWVINHTKDIRPYGVILIKKEAYKKYISISSQFGSQFEYSQFKDEIQQHQKKAQAYQIQKNQNN